jgi:nucleoside-diphosphate-sugar epimerase
MTRCGACWIIRPRRATRFSSSPAAPACCRSAPTATGAKTATPRTSLLRHGGRWRRGWISDLYHSGQATGAVCYVGRGLNLYSSVHVDDLAELYALALHRGVGGALYHAVSGELNFRSMAQATAGHLGVGTRSVSVAESIEIWDRFTGPLTMSSCSRTRCPRARKDLGWSPDPGRLDILDDCGHATYRNQPPRALPAWVRTDAPQSTRAA